MGVGRAMSGRRNVLGEDGIGRIKRKANRVGEMRTFGRVEREREKVVREGYIGQKECSGRGWRGAY